MATIRYYAATPSDMVVAGQEGVLLNQGETSAEITTRFAGDTIVLSGQSFAYEGDVLVGGTATDFVYKTGGNTDYYRITNFEWDLSLGTPTSASVLLDGDDFVIGSRASDTMRAGDGNDVVRGGRGNDVIFAGEGNDMLRGGRGSDSFVFYIGDGVDRIRDFDAYGPIRDKIFLPEVDSVGDVTMGQRNGNAYIEYGDGDRIILKGIELHDLSRHSFDFG